MKNVFIIGLVAILSAAVSTAYAQQPLTREQVKAELAQAIHDGNVITGDSGETQAQLYPWAYPQASKAQGLTREQVLAELKRAQRDGDIEVGDSGLTLAQLYPQEYPHPNAATALTREQVKAELARAIRDGDLPPTGDSEQTLAQQFPDVYAAARLRDGESKFASN